MSMKRASLIASVVWVLAVFAYGIGYLAELDAVDTTRKLPTLDFMFLAFAIAGPLAMLWIVVALLSKAEMLSENIGAQGESALALAATVANLNDSIDALSAATQGRLIEACDRMERHSDNATATFERNLEETGSRLNRVMLESVVLIDERIAGRVDAFEAALERQRASLDQHLRDDTVRVADALEAQAAAMEQRLNDDTGRLSAAVAAELATLSELKSNLVDYVSGGLTDSRQQMDHGIAELLAHQQAGLEESNRRLTAAVDAFTSTLSELQTGHGKLLESDIGAPVRALAAEVQTTRQELAAKPPATAEALADLLGKSTQLLLRHDRKQLEEVVLRVENLEQKAGRMLDQIDRTSRLNPLMDLHANKTDVAP
ncbi:MAG: hypothetical protein AB8B85_08415, partial [Paracoccaceae bacterium]